MYARQIPKTSANTEWRYRIKEPLAQSFAWKSECFPNLVLQRCLPSPLQQPHTVSSVSDLRSKVDIKTLIVTCRLSAHPRVHPLLHVKSLSPSPKMSTSRPTIAEAHRLLQISALVTANNPACHRRMGRRTHHQHHPSLQLNQNVPQSPATLPFLRPSMDPNEPSSANSSPGLGRHFR